MRLECCGTNHTLAVCQPPPLKSRPHSLLFWCLCFFLYFFGSNLVSSAFPCLCLSLMFYFYFSSIFPISSFVLLVFPFSGLLVTFPVLCDCPCQMLPITVRNMPSISPLILKRLKVPFSSPIPQPVDANRYHPSAKVGQSFLSTCLIQQMAAVAS